MSIIDDSKYLPKRLKPHQLNNQGCKCKFCQTSNIKETMKIVKKKIEDNQSECYSDQTAQGFIQVIESLAQLDQKKRKIRFAIPQICIFDKGVPNCLISKKRQKDPVSIVKNKAKMHLFDIYNFFLEGFISHNPNRVPQTSSMGKKKSSYAKILQNESVALGKYKNNHYQMLSLFQIQGLFKSNQKYLRDGLLYLQTLVSSKSFNQNRVRVRLDSIKDQELINRAKIQAKIIHGDVKTTDNQFISQKQETDYENKLKKQNLQKFLFYISLKIICLISKNKRNIIQDGIFKYVVTKEALYIWDIRINQYSSSQAFWAQSVKAAFQQRLQKKMSILEMEGAQRDASFSLGRRASQMTFWLENSTQNQWKQLGLIRNRLSKLQDEKRSLIQSQSCNQGGNLTKTFKIRPKKRYLTKTSHMIGQSMIE